LIQRKKKKRKKKGGATIYFVCAILRIMEVLEVCTRKNVVCAMPLKARKSKGARRLAWNNNNK